MSEDLQVRNIIKHLANDTLSELCFTCLNQLTDNAYESIYTIVGKEENEYAIADVLKAVCLLKLDGTEHFNVCIDCFKLASVAFKFHLQVKHSMETLTYYTEELLNSTENVEINSEDSEKILCIPLSHYTAETSLFDFDIDGIGQGHIQYDDIKTSEEFKVEDEKLRLPSYKIKSEEALIDSENEDEGMIMIINEKKTRRKRDPMTFMSCTKCSVKYRFVSKLKEHMKSVHNIDLYYCKICKITTENKVEYEEHIRNHTENHICTICNAIYKKQESLLTHMKVHEKEKDVVQCENANICEVCGAILEDEHSLKEHVASKHVKQHTCYYCGRMYKGQHSFERHIQKHEAHLNNKYGNEIEATSELNKDSDKPDLSKRSICPTCGKDFVDERSLLWHQRLHNNERPFTCDVCGRAFVSKNRRNQHSLCAHTPPTRRCPLCPALFHLRSMVNTHLKKVHLKEHKRRNRQSKHQNVSWRTEAVPIRELSVDLQNDVLELQFSNQLDNASTSNEPALAPSTTYLFM